MEVTLGSPIHLVRETAASMSSSARGSIVALTNFLASSSRKTNRFMPEAIFSEHNISVIAGCRTLKSIQKSP